MFEQKLKDVDLLINTRMQSQHAVRIPELSSHLINAGGKRIRPLLTIACAKICDYEGELDVKLATTVEFIHSATLLHDDVVDESDKRRGLATANQIWDNKSSVLVGDYLFSRSFQLMVETENLKVLEVLSNASAVIAEGEVLQLTAAQDIKTSEETYFQVIRGKTAALFAAACEVGGIIANASEAEIKTLREYGMALGLAFQIADDVLDYTATSEFGKKLGNDFAECKLTLPVIRAIENADPHERDFWKRTIGRGEQNDDDFSHALQLLEKYQTIKTSRETALSLSNDAKNLLKSFKETPTKTSLIALCDQVVNRLV